MVICTNAEYAPFFSKQRSAHNTVIIVQEFHDLSLQQEPWKSIWRETHSLDPEGHIYTSEMYAVYAMKQAFVRKAAKENPFASKWFVWIDVGLFREESDVDCLQIESNRPMQNVPLICDDDRMVLMQVYPINQTLLD